MKLSEAVVRDPRIMSGALCFRGTRVLVQTLFDYIEEGHSIGRFLEGFPSVSREQVDAVLHACLEDLESDVSLAA